MYAFDDLGWAQFERLCEELLRVEGLEPVWEGRADVGRIGSVAGGIVAIVWVRPFMRTRLARASLFAQLAVWLAKEAQGRPLRLFTNVELDEEEQRELRALGGYEGPRELSAHLDREPVVRRRVPSVLGVRDLDGLIAPDVLTRSTGDAGAARELARVFVPTRAYARALATLERHRFAVLSGPPEMGKTAIARMLGLALLTEGWELHECVRPDELWAQFARDRPQVFIADDAFGSTEYRPESAERWGLELDRVLRALDERHRLIWTSRPTPLKAALRRVHREHGVERWPQPAEIHVAADDLDVEEKALILFRHVRAARLGDDALDLVRARGWDIVSHRHFTPERIRRFVGGRLPGLAAGISDRFLRAAIEHEIREPTMAMAKSLRALPREHRNLLVSLLDVAPGPVPERELAAAARRHAAGGMPKRAAELVDRLTDHFLRVVPPTSVTWVHPSWRDLVIDELAADATARRSFLARCSIDGALLALSTGGGAAGERALPLLRDDADWDAFADRQHRLLEELAAADAARLLGALAEALSGDPSEQVRRELAPLAVELLDALRRGWDARRATVAPATLDAWFALAECLDEPPRAPEVDATWSRLAPDDLPDLDSPAELNRFDDWLRLAETLADHAPETLDRLGFPDDQLSVLQRFVVRAQGLLEREQPPPTAALVAQLLRRLSAVAPYVVPRVVSTARRLEAEAALWHATELPEALPSFPVAAPGIVSRILGDLGR